MAKRVGFLVNPIAGMGGRVGLKGTDGVVSEARLRGASPHAEDKARETLAALKTCTLHEPIAWVTCAGAMGEHVLVESGQTPTTIVYRPGPETTAADTKSACRRFLESGVDLILFCGGDGTARDVFDVVKHNVPLLGIPSGVKMHSGVFGISAQATAKILASYVNGVLTTGDADILDVDEEAYRHGEWKVRLYGVACGIVEPTYVQVGKATYESVSDDQVKEELADHIKEEMARHPEALFLFGPGGTIEHILSKLGIPHTLLGIDAVYQGVRLKEDLTEQDILSFLEAYPSVRLVLSPIGAQGFLLGRGNLQLSPAVVRKIGLDNIIIVATPAKLADTPLLRVDSGDTALDEAFVEKEFFLVVIGYRLSRVVKIQTNNY